MEMRNGNQLVIHVSRRAFNEIMAQLDEAERKGLAYWEDKRDMDELDFGEHIIRCASTKSSRAKEKSNIISMDRDFLKEAKIVADPATLKELNPPEQPE